MSSNACTKEEWKTYIQKAQEGDKHYRDELVDENIGLVYMVIKRFYGRGCEMEDLFQIGVIGLLKAIDKFDLNRELSFSTYAVPLIIGEIRRFLRDDGMIHVSRQIKENARKIAAVKEERKKKSNCELTIEELSQATGLSPDDILLAVQATTEVESIYQPIGKDGSEMTLADQLMDTKKNEAEVIDKITVNQLLERLGEKDRRLLELRFWEGKTQSESAKLLGMNQVAVSRLEKRILIGLRKQLS